MNPLIPDRRLRLVTALTTLIIAISITETTSAEECDRVFSHLSIEEGLSANHVKAILRDRNGFLWIGTSNGLNRYDGSSIKRYEVRDMKKNKGNNNVGALYEDSEGTIWIGTDRGCYRYNPTTDSMEYADDWNSVVHEGFLNWVQDIEGDKEGNVWVLIPDMGIFRTSKSGAGKYVIPSNGEYKEIYFNDLCMTPDGTLWTCSSDGRIFRYDKGEDRLIEVKFDFPADSKLKFSRLIPDSDSGLIAATEDVQLFRISLAKDHSVARIPLLISDDMYFRSMTRIGHDLWIGTQTGLMCLDMLTGKQTKHLTEPLNPHSISDNTIYTLYSDSDRNLWAGTVFGGVNLSASHGFDFHAITPSDFNGRRVRGMAFTSDFSQLVMGSESNGISIFNPDIGSFIPAPAPLTTKSATMCVTLSDGRVLIGMERNGLIAYSPGKPPYQYLPRQLSNENTVYAYLLDSDGCEWVGLGYALYRRCRGEEDFSKVNETEYNWIFTLAEDRNGNVWIGSMGSGLYRFSRKENSYQHYGYDENNPDPKGLKSNSINSILCDRKGRVWISTDRGGLSLYSPSTDSFSTFGRSEGLPDEIVYKALEDSKGNLWFGTNNGLVRMNPESRLVTVFTTRDGLPANEFTYNSAVCGPDSTFYFGTINGTLAFNPNIGHEPHRQYPVLFTSFYGADGAPEDGNIAFADEIVLPYDRNTFSLSVGAPSAIGLQGTKRFSYRLLPGDGEWLPMEGNRLSFTNLASGKYTLEVMMQCGEAVSSRSLRIIVRSPWWWSGWAITLYVLLGIAAIALAFILYRRRELRRLHERQEKFTSDKEKEVYRQKLDFFTEIAHEIRTPLSLIDLPLEAMEERGLDSPESEHYLKVTRQNTARLLELTSQLLDFQKIEAGKLRLKSEAVDLTELMNYTLDRFEPAISLRDKTLTRHIGKGSIVTITDREAFTKIISNLLNNALKYAESDITVSLETEDDTVFVKVISDGEKISDENSERIFETFYQTDKSQEQKNGVGIGLPLSRSLAVLLGGSLYLEKSPSRENVFVLSLPLKATSQASGQLATNDHGSSIVYEEDSNQTPLTANGYHVLLVEDNEGIRSMLNDRLASSFLITLASNGKEALDILATKTVDVIVTDIMMPEMDGFELCRRIKSDPDLSHIPVVFITAKNDLDSKVKGLQYGAEAYIEKPFSVKYLREMVVSLLENRRRAREAFAKKPFFEAENIPVNKEDEKFMEKVLAVIKENMGDEEFNVESLGDKMCMSRSNLLRHIKSVFNLSPSELIRVVRLKTAAELIKTGAYTLGDISRMIGISSQSYFTKMFFKQFNIMPGEFAKQVTEVSNAGT